MSALRMPATTTVLRAQDYSEEQLRRSLSRKGWETNIPDWLPARPLLVGYLVGRDLLPEVITLDGRSAPAEGWNTLLDRISDRESNLASDPGVDGPLLRQILERLATIARTKGNGLGPLGESDLTTDFRQVCGYVPDEGSYQLLQRLPGLGAQDSGDGSRSFIDQCVADALRAGDLVRYVTGPRPDGLVERFHGSAALMDKLGVEVAALQLGETSDVLSVLNATRQLQNSGVSDTYVADLLRVAAEMSGGDVQAPALAINDVVFPTLVISAESGDLSKWSSRNA